MAIRKDLLQSFPSQVIGQFIACESPTDKIIYFINVSSVEQIRAQANTIVAVTGGSDSPQEHIVGRLQTWSQETLKELLFSIMAEIESSGVDEKDDGEEE